VGKCYGQDSIKYENILMVQQILPDSGKTEVMVRYIKRKMRIKVFCLNDQKYKGRIEAIDDSGVIIKGMLIKPGEIKSVNRIRGRAIRYTGVSLLGTGALIMMISQLYYSQPKVQSHNQYYMGGEANWGVPAIGIMLVGAITTIVGAIDQISVKHYDVGWKFSIAKKALKK
jgi:hypothetical protein